MNDTLETVLGWVNDILSSSGRRLPDHVVAEILRKFGGKVPTPWMDELLAQLIKLCQVAPSMSDPLEVQVASSKLLYRAGNRLVFGTTEFKAECGLEIVETSLKLVGGKPCWIERTINEPHGERLVLAGQGDQMHPRYSISEIRDDWEAPMYCVNYRSPTSGEDVGFVVTAFKNEGRHYESVSNLVITSSDYAYVAHDGQTHENVLVVNGNEVFRGLHVRPPCIAGGHIYTVCTLRNNEYSEEIWKGRERWLTAHRVRGLCVVDGKPAYACQKVPEERFMTQIRDEGREFASIMTWWSPTRGNRKFVVFDGDKPDVGVWVNYTRLCDGVIKPNAISYEEKTSTLRIHLEGETGVRTFDLKELGIV
jgi:hypothetical protein